MREVIGRGWFDEFATKGPGYEGQWLSVPEAQGLLLKAAIGGRLPSRQAQDLSALAPLLMSDPQLLAMAVAALDGHHHGPLIEGTAEHVVMEQVKVLMAAPLVVDALVAGAKRVVLHDADWPLLLWPYLAHASQVYGMKFACSNGGKGTVMITVTVRDELDSFGEPQSIPKEIMKKLSVLAGGGSAFEASG